MKTNAFNERIYEIAQVLCDNEINDYVKNTLSSVLGTLEIADPEAIADEVVEIAKNNNQDNYEKIANSVLAKEGVISRIPQKLSNRAEQIHSQIQEHIHGETVLDFGCGDGKVGDIISKEGRKVKLADVYKHDHIDNIDLDFFDITGDKVIGVHDQHDTTLLLTVLHHCDDPLKTLEEAKALTKKGGKILVIESVYGVEHNSQFGELDQEQQRKANIFFDHFYNRVIHYSENPETKVNVPFNFNTPKGWKKIFEENGLEEKVVVHLGQDQPTVPEYHTLHVLEVKE